MISNQKELGCAIQNEDTKVDCQIHFCYREDMSAAATRPAKLTRRGRETRERIVAAAAELMFKDGVAGTTVDDVKDAAGVSSSQIYHYFTDKKALVLAVIDYQSETIVGAQEPMYSWSRSLKT